MTTREEGVSIDMLPDTPVKLWWKDQQYGGIGFMKGEVVETDHCVTPQSFAVRAYCLTSPTDDFEPTVFYVDMRASSSPDFMVRQYSGEQEDFVSGFFSIDNERKTVVRFFTNANVPYAKVEFSGADGKVARTEYFRVVDGRVWTSATSLLPLEHARATTRLIERFTEDVPVAAPNTAFNRLHEMRISIGEGERARLLLLDDNFNVVKQGGSFVVNPELKKEESGLVVLDVDLDVDSLTTVASGGLGIPS
jgi:hypothetical protein